MATVARVYIYFSPQQERLLAPIYYVGLLVDAYGGRCQKLALLVGNCVHCYIIRCLAV